SGSRNRVLEPVDAGDFAPFAFHFFATDSWQPRIDDSGATAERPGTGDRPIAGTTHRRERRGAFRSWTRKADGFADSRTDRQPVWHLLAPGLPRTGGRRQRPHQGKPMAASSGLWQTYAQNASNIARGAWRPAH